LAIAPLRSRRKNLMTKVFDNLADNLYGKHRFVD